MHLCMTFLAVLFACYFELPSQASITVQPSAVTCHRPLNLWKILVNLISSLWVLTGRLTPEAEAIGIRMGRKGQIRAASLLPQLKAQPVLLLTETFPSARRESCTVWPPHYTGWDTAEVPNRSTQSSWAQHSISKLLAPNTLGLTLSLLLLIGFWGMTRNLHLHRRKMQSSLAFSPRCRLTHMTYHIVRKLLDKDEIWDSLFTDYPCSGDLLVLVMCSRLILMSCAPTMLL